MMCDEERITYCIQKKRYWVYCRYLYEVPPLKRFLKKNTRCDDSFTGNKYNLCLCTLAAVYMRIIKTL